MPRILILILRSPHRKTAVLYLGKAMRGPGKRRGHKGKQIDEYPGLGIDFPGIEYLNLPVCIVL